MMSDIVENHRVAALWRVKLPSDLYEAWGIAVGVLLGIMMWIAIITGTAALMASI